jgi:hypothetical protein
MLRWRRERRFLRLGCRENSSGSRSGGGDGRRLADGVAVDHKFDAAIALAAVGGIVRSDGLRFAEAVSGHGRGCHTLLGEEIADAVRAPFGELLVESIGAHAVGVPFNLKR